jgi:hypothetical protein
MGALGHACGSIPHGAVPHVQRFWRGDRHGAQGRDELGTNSETRTMLNMVKEFNILDPLEAVHQALMKESELYKYAFENKLGALVCRLQLAYIEKQIAKQEAK